MYTIENNLLYVKYTSIFMYLNYITIFENYCNEYYYSNIIILNCHYIVLQYYYTESFLYYNVRYKLLIIIIK